MKPGIYEGIPFDDYLKIDAVSNSLLNEFRSCPARAKYYMDNGSVSTEAMNMGSALHTAVLEPHLFDSRFVVAEPCCANTKKGTRCTLGGAVVDEK